MLYNIMKYDILLLISLCKMQLLYMKDSCFKVVSLLRSFFTIKINDKAYSNVNVYFLKTV